VLDLFSYLDIQDAVGGLDGKQFERAVRHSGASYDEIAAAVRNTPGGAWLVDVDSVTVGSKTVRNVNGKPVCK